MKTCIATSDYFVQGETFINRHIAHIFGGDTCVLAGRFNGNDPLGKPLFERRAPLSLADRLRAPFAMGWNAARTGTGRLPFGDAKARLRDWLQAQEVEVVLAEFGTQALVVAGLARGRPWAFGAARSRRLGVRMLRGRENGAAGPRRRVLTGQVRWGGRERKRRAGSQACGIRLD